MLVHPGRLRTPYKRPLVSLLLDLYPNAAAAYSLRKLRTDYAGSAIRVRESGGDTELDIGFSGNDLDEAALTDHCGANDGFVVTWYDQSGNGLDWAQATTAEQFLIVSSGTVINRSGKIALERPLPNETYHYTVAKNGTATQTIFFVLEVASDDTGDQGITGGTASNEYIGRFQDESTFTTISSPDGHGAIYVNGVLFSGSTRDDLFEVIKGRSIASVENADMTEFAELRSGGRVGAPVKWMHEYVIYDTDESSDRAAIESAINTYYSIY